MSKCGHFIELIIFNVKIKHKKLNFIHTYMCVMCPNVISDPLFILCDVVRRGSLLGTSCWNS